MKRLAKSLNFLSNFTDNFVAETTAVYCIIEPDAFGVKTHKELARLFSKHYDVIMKHRNSEIEDFVSNRPNDIVRELVNEAINLFFSVITLLSGQRRNASEPVVFYEPLVKDGKFVEDRVQIVNRVSLMKDVIKDLTIEFPL